VALGRGGFQVVDLRRAKLELVVHRVAYRGFLDAGIVPYGVAGASRISQLRVAIELKHTAVQKKAYQEVHGQGTQVTRRWYEERSQIDV
jgi:hypothetical protein